MSYVTMMTLLAGVVLSSISGVICYMGSMPLTDQFDWIPYSDLLLDNPQMTLACGAMLILSSLLCQPGRAC